MEARTALLDYLNSRLTDACAELKLEDLTAPFLVAMYEKSPGEYSFEEKDVTDNFIDNEGKDRLVKELKELSSSNPSLVGLAISFDGYSLSIKEGDKIPDSIAKSKGSETALLTFAYVRGNKTPSMRAIPYMRKGIYDYWFGDDGWEEIPTTGRFANPFN